MSNIYGLFLLSLLVIFGCFAYKSLNNHPISNLGGTVPTGGRDTNGLHLQSAGRDQKEGDGWLV